MSNEVEVFDLRPPWYTSSGRPPPSCFKDITPVAVLMSVSKRRRQRRPTLTAALKQADKAGATVAGVEIKPDGSIALAFGKETSPESSNDLDKWMAKHHAN